jgi:hypothetical protein
VKFSRAGGEKSLPVLRSRAVGPDLFERERPRAALSRLRIVVGNGGALIVDRNALPAPKALSSTAVGSTTAIRSLYEHVGVAMQPSRVGRHRG